MNRTQLKKFLKKNQNHKMENTQLMEWKEDYEKIEIPAQLKSVVENSIQNAKEHPENVPLKEKTRFWNLHTLRICGASVVVAMATFVLLANSNTQIVSAMEKIPFLNSLVNAVTFQIYQNTTDDGSMEANVKVPQISEKDAEEAGLAHSVGEMNQQIQKYTNAIIEQYERDVTASAEYSENVGLTGHQLVDTDYQIITGNEKLFSLRIDTSIVMAGSMQETKIYHIDKTKDEMITLKDLFVEGSNYSEIVSESIKKQMKKQMEECETVVYWYDDTSSMEGFQSVSEEDTFYINEDGELTIVFDKYEVAPGYMGKVEIVVPTEDIVGILIEDFFEMD